MSQKPKDRLLLRFSIHIDFKKLLEIHERLSKGEVIDSGKVNGVILGGIVNIFIQHNAIEELVEKVKSVEEVNKTLNTRVESLETWNTKLSEEINKFTEHIDTLDANGVIVKESGEIIVLKKKVVDLEI